jgi:hypothetical protein
MEGSLVAYKVFTNGSTLQASEVNENLMQQSVATFTNAAARTAAITSPVEGQLTYLEDTNQYASWDGSSWVNPFEFGMTLLNKTSFTAASVVTIDNLFTTDYDYYKVIIDTTGSGSSSLLAQFRKGGVTTAGTGYYWSYYGWTSAGAASASQGGAQSSFIAQVGIVGFRNTSSIEIHNPKNAVQTTVHNSISFFDGTNLVSRFGSAYNTSTTDFDGIIFTTTSGTTTGTITTYGLRK